GSARLAQPPGLPGPAAGRPPRAPGPAAGAPDPAAGAPDPAGPAGPAGSATGTPAAGPVCTVRPGPEGTPPGPRMPKRARPVEPKAMAIALLVVEPST